MSDLIMRKTTISSSTIVLLLALGGMSLDTALAGGADSKGGQVDPRKDTHRDKLTFVLKEGSRTQKLEAEFISEYKMNFVLSLDGPCRKTISGLAVGFSGDYEMEDDGKGGTYPAISYSFKGKDDYELSISIAVETKGYKRDKAILLEAEDKSGCPVIVKTMNLVK